MTHERSHRPSTRTVEKPTCQQCGADLPSLTIDVDEWNAFYCTRCGPHADVPDSAVKYVAEPL